MIARLGELETDLIARRSQAIQEGWSGEVGGLDLTLEHLSGKRDRAQRLPSTTTM
ncbi:MULTISPECIES: recombinase [Arthrobacter]|uniref:Recombinase n=1 Tax=Arthrobacter terricola TaxID=2547396 RepID=A0A4R5KZK6_9MICC|nr:MULTISPECIES: recombinase [Arthrobacter]MBT8159522.1 hypothetical protein [Arthrobacter sp. GN70]TDG01347.1 recombinase [Arthrobacter terricola]